jgi:predicted O-methyltransferase YrrM
MTNKSIGLSQDLHDYICHIGVKTHPVLSALQNITAKMPESKMQISPEQGQFLSFMIKLLRVKTALEIGVYTGYSSTCIALSLPDDGHLTCIDPNAEWTKVAKKHWHMAGIDQKITFHLGKAGPVLEQLKKNQKKFDFIFVDADKKSYPTYTNDCLDLLSDHGLLILDNILINGKVLDPQDTSENVEILRNLNLSLAEREDIDLSILPLGDGLTMIRKRS